MEKTICELFAGVGGFRLAFDRTNDEMDSDWRTVWFSQWEPGAKTQWAHECYVRHFGDSPDLAGEYHTNDDIASVDKNNIPDHSLLVGGFPCQDYSVAHSLSTSSGIEGKKGVLWWQIVNTIEAKHPAFCLFENVDRLLKSPAKQRGRDFAIMLSCFANLGYTVEWRIVNGAVYGAPQRRRRVFIFAYRNDTNYAHQMEGIDVENIITRDGFMAHAFPIEETITLREVVLPRTINEQGEDVVDTVVVSDEFKYEFKNAGYMTNGNIYTTDITEIAEEPITLGEILEEGEVDESYFINGGDRMEKWTYLKGSKKIERTTKEGYTYMFSEGAIPFPDPWNKPSRTMLTSEGTLNRSTHVVADRRNGMLRLLTPIETERLQGFDDNWTEGMPDRMRRFCMGNALIVGMVQRMARVLTPIIENED